MMVGIIYQTSSILAWELAVLEGAIDLGKCCPNDSDFIFDRIFIRLADNVNNPNIFDEFESGSDRTIHMRDTCHLVSVRHIMMKMLSEG